MVLSLGGFLWYLRLAGDPPRPGEASFSLEISSPPEQVVAGEAFDVTLSMQNRSPFAYVLGTNGRPFRLLFYKEGERESYAEELVLLSRFFSHGQTETYTYTCVPEETGAYVVEAWMDFDYDGQNLCMGKQIYRVKVV